ncbi:MAG: hypothetical protein LBI06_02715 [Treponema sp.]|nr:hypothetical protein [Treponema sp.]
MRRLLFSVIIFGILFSNCSKDIEEFEYDNSNSFLTVAKWKITGKGRIALYEFRERAGVSRLTTSWLNSNMRVGSKTVNAKMGDIEQGIGFISFKINGTRYVYRQE